MKKLWLIGLSLLLILSLASCADAAPQTAPPAPPEEEDVQSVEPSEMPEAVPTIGSQEPAAAPEDDDAPQMDEPDVPPDDTNPELPSPSNTSAPQPPAQEETPDASEEEGSRILTAYFSMIDVVPEGADAVTHATPSAGNTRTAAQEIQAQAGGDLFQIKTSLEYPVGHSDCSVIAEDEMRSDARPALTAQVSNMADYGVVFVGYPIWWYTSPMAVRSFLEAYDFSGKTIVPFCTTMGAGVSQSVGEIKGLCPDATVLNGLTLRTGRADDMPGSISIWLTELNLL